MKMKIDGKKRLVGPLIKAVLAKDLAAVICLWWKAKGIVEGYVPIQPLQADRKYREHARAGARGKKPTPGNRSSAVSLNPQTLVASGGQAARSSHLAHPYGNELA